MNNGCMGAELVQIIGHPVIKAGANGENNIRMVHGGIGFKSAVHTQHSRYWRSVLDSHPDPSGVGNREIELLGQCGQLLGGVIDNYTTTGIDNRTLKPDRVLTARLICPR